MEALPSDLGKIAALSFLLLINFGVIFSEKATITEIIDTMQVDNEVADVNNNRPVFLKHKYEVAVKSKLSLFSTVFQMEVTDKDLGGNGKLRFKIESGSDEFFWITSSGSIVLIRSLDTETLRLFNLTVSVSDQGQPPLTADRTAQLSLLVFQPLQVPIYFQKGTYTTIKVQFILKFLNKRNVAKYGIIVQQSNPGDSRVAEYKEREPLTWYQVYSSKEDGQSVPYRYITAIIQSNIVIEAKGMLEFMVGTEDCHEKKEKDDYCNGPLTAGNRYRFQLRAYVENTGPFTDLSFKDSEYSRCLVEMPANAAGIKRL